MSRCDDCTYHSYDWFDDYEEFEVCLKNQELGADNCPFWEEL